MNNHTQRILHPRSQRGMAPSESVLGTQHCMASLGICKPTSMNRRMAWIREPDVFCSNLCLALSEAVKTLVIATHDLSQINELHARVALLPEEHRIEMIGFSEDISKGEDLLLKVNLIHEHAHHHGGGSHTDILIMSFMDIKMEKRVSPK